MQRLRIAAAPRVDAPVLSAAALALVAVLLLLAAGLIGPPSATASGESSSLAAPTVTAFTPISGPVGTSVTVSGARLTGATRVTFNGTRAATFSVLSATRLRATVPSRATTGRIAVTTSGGTATSAARFTVTKAVTAPKVTAFTPASGPVGTSVTVTGSSFTGATRIAFNDTAAATFSVLSATRLRATVPSGAATGKIAVTTSGGTATSAA